MSHLTDNTRLLNVKKALESNNFTVYLAENAEEAGRLVLEKIIPETGAKSLSWGGSMTMDAAGLFEELPKLKGIKVIDPQEAGVPWPELFERRRQALLVDLFISGTNAITESGALVNLDAVGNRITGINFGPKHVIILAGRNKIVPDLTAAMKRIKEYVAPANSKALGFKTPCASSGKCANCKSPSRICNAWSILEKCWEKGRIKVILINQDLGL